MSSLEKIVDETSTTNINSEPTHESTSLGNIESINITQSKNEKIKVRVEKVFYQIRLLQKEARYVLKKIPFSLEILAVNLLLVMAYSLIPALVVSENGAVPLGYSFQVMGVTNFLAGAIPLPSGYGSVELIFYGMLKQYSAELEAAGALVILRLFTVIIPCFIGGVLWILQKRRGNKNLHL